MMEALRQARTLYVKSYSNGSSLSEGDKSQLKKDIQRFINIAIKESNMQNIFINPCMLDVFNVALREKASLKDSDLTPVIKAFESLEYYILLLLEHPWKPEYKKLKTYGGFYRTKIKSVLINPEQIFETAGYVPTSNEIMIHKGLIDKSSLLLLAFDCKIASVQSRAVADAYCKEKNIGKSLSTVVADRLGTPEGMMKQEQSSGEIRGHKTDVNVYGNRDVLNAPPALPKRDPISNLQTRPQVQYESAVAGGLETSIDNLSLQNKGRVAGTDIRLQQHLTQSEPVRSPLLSTCAIQNTMFQFNDSHEERIPELPQGTVDEHMRESLKLISQGGRKLPVPSSSHNPPSSNSEDWKWFRDIQMSSAAPPVTSRLARQMAGSNQLSVNTYPPGNVRYKPILYPSGNDASLSTDEGLGSSRFMQSSLQASYSQVTSPPQEPHLEMRFSQQIPQIYTPPPLEEADSAISLKQNRIPPPIPSRALKPPQPNKTIKSDDIKGDIHTNPRIQSGNINHKSGINDFKKSIAITNSRPVIQPETSKTEPVLRRDRYRVGGKSSSLKYGDERSTAVHEMANRPARSMDMTMTQWLCKSCSNLNMSSDLVCSICTGSRQGSDIICPEQYSNRKKACPRCTLQNDPNLTHCSICESPLEDKFTYI